MSDLKTRLAAYIADLKQQEAKASDEMYQLRDADELETIGGAMWTERSLQLRRIIQELTQLLYES